MSKERKSARQALLEAVARRGDKSAKSGEVIAEALGNVQPPLAGKTPKATLAAQLVYLVRDGLVVRKAKGLVALAPTKGQPATSGASGASPEPKPRRSKAPAKPPKKSTSRSRPPKSDASG